MAKTSNQSPDLSITRRNIPGHKGSTRLYAILAGTAAYSAQKLPLFGNNCPNQWYMHSQGVCFYTQDLHAFRLPIFQTRGPYQLVLHAQRPGVTLCGLIA